MFTGIIETTGIVKNIQIKGTNKTFWISSPVSHEFKVDQSISHNGVCLTVEEIEKGAHCITAIEETLKKSALNNWKTGDEINLERCMLMNGRIDGHIVQGHVDTTAICIERKDMKGSWEYRFAFDKSFANFIIEKGSIAVNGISLTIFNVGENEFSVAIVPYTYEHTSIKTILPESVVNIEFDMIGKYIERMIKHSPDS